MLGPGRLAAMVVGYLTKRKTFFLSPKEHHDVDGDDESLPDSGD